jgi:hypothetical protein
MSVHQSTALDPFKTFLSLHAFNPSESKKSCDNALDGTERDQIVFDKLVATKYLLTSTLSLLIGTAEEKCVSFTLSMRTRCFGLKIPPTCVLYIYIWELSLTYGGTLSSNYISCEIITQNLIFEASVTGGTELRC